MTEHYPTREPDAHLSCVAKARPAPHLARIPLGYPARTVSVVAALGRRTRLPWKRERTLNTPRRVRRRELKVVLPRNVQFG